MFVKRMAILREGRRLTNIIRTKIKRSIIKQIVIIFIVIIFDRNFGV